MGIKSILFRGQHSSWIWKAEPTNGAPAGSHRANHCPFFYIMTQLEIQEISLRAGHLTNVPAIAKGEMGSIPKENWEILIKRAKGPTYTLMELII